MSIQLAYYYTQNDSSATYETGTARGFYHGRTGNYLLHSKTQSYNRI